MKRLTISVLTLALVACATTKQSAFVDAASTPLRDLNVVRADIPAVLREAQKQPYLAPTEQSCSALWADVRVLDEVLGPDLDAPASASNPRLIERAEKMAEDAAVDALRGAAEGAVRRGFLRGLIVARDCPRGD